MPPADKAGAAVAIPTTPSQIAPENLKVCSLLYTFDIVALGEGNLIAGANTLAAMACAIANVQRPGSRIEDEDGTGVAVGTSLLVSGGLSTSVIAEKVVSGLGSRQNNFVAHLRDWHHLAAREQAAPPNTRGFNPGELMEKDTSTTLYDLQNDVSFPGTVTSAAYAALVKPPAGYGKRDLFNRPSVFVTAAKPAELTKALGHCHLGRPFIHVGLDQAADSPRFGDVCLGAMDGRLTTGPLAETVRGHVLVTDPAELLAEIIHGGDTNGGWLARMPWLTDCAAGPDLGLVRSAATATPTAARGQAAAKFNGLQARYEAAMDMAWGGRFDFRETAPATLKLNGFAPWQAAWVRFLKTMEADLPGITGAARPLLATLMFGLTQIAGAAKAPAGVTWCVADVEPFARWLVRRMANARAALMHAGRQARLERLATKIMHKLNDQKPLKIRDISRMCHHLGAEDCQEALSLLLLRGTVACTGSRWFLREAAGQRREPELLTLDV